MNTNQSSPFEIIDRSHMAASLNLVANCQDCACAEPSAERVAAPRLQLAAQATYTTAPELRLEPLAAGYWSAFNPTGEAGVVVVNRPAYELLQRFQQPQSIASNPPETNAALARLLNLGLLQQAGRSQLPQLAEEKTLSVWLHLTNQCNLRCTYCYLNKTNEYMSQATGQAAIDAVLRSAVAEDYQAIKLKYAGGEAALNIERVFEIHDYALAKTQTRGLALQAVLLSNGTTLTAEIIAGLKTRQIKVMVSLDGLAEGHDTQRPYVGGQPSAHKVLAGIERLIEAGLPPHLSITITAHNCRHIDQVVRFALERKLTFSLNFYRDNEWAISPERLQYGEEQLIAGMEAAYQAIEANLPAWSVIGAVLDRGQLLAPHERACGVGHDYLAIDQHGQIAKCNMELNRPVTDIRAINPLNVIRLSTEGVQNPSALEKEGCRTCEWRYWCTGGCPVATYRATGRYDVKSPNCNIYRAIYPQAVRLEGLRLLKYAAPLKRQLG